MLKFKEAEREVPLHGVPEGLLYTVVPKSGRLFPNLSVNRIVKRHAYLRRRHPELHGTVFQSTRKCSSLSVSAQGFLSTSLPVLLGTNQQGPRTS